MIRKRAKWITEKATIVIKKYRLRNRRTKYDKNK